MTIAPVADLRRTPMGLRRHLLNFNENPFRPLPSVVEAISAAVADVNRYPEFLPTRLPAIIADHLCLEPEQVIVGVGATGVAFQVIRAVTRSRERIVCAYPTFDGYPIMADIADLEFVTVPLDAVGCNDLPSLAAAARDGAAVVVLCNPHNPTGTVLAEEDFEAFMDEVPAHVVVILDEAYVEFVDPARRIDAREAVRRHSNLFVIRTFSKAYGLAGMRIGYGFAAAELAEHVRPKQLPFAVGSLAEAAVSASFEAEDELSARVDAIIAEREWLRRELLKRGVWATESQGNFLYLTQTEAMDGFAARLGALGVQVKSFVNGDVRITVGDRGDSRAALAALSK